MPRMKLNLFITLLCINCILFRNNAFPLNDEREAKLYLQKFGYIDDGRTSAALLAPDAISSALKDFQRLAGIKQTGRLDNDTITMMKKPRCGVKDKFQHSESPRKKRYAIHGSKWRLTHLTYGIKKYPDSLRDRTKVAKEIERAFKVWSNVTNLTFNARKRGRVNIEIRFENGEHGDGKPFDGPNKILAHAFFPQFGGHIHFDNEENWTTDEDSGYKLFQVAAHEFGHSLGLLHSQNRQALMAPFYEEYVSSFKLHRDDVEAIQSLYGSREQPEPPKDGEHSSPPPDISYAPDICQDARIDTVARTEDGNTYVFKDSFYWKILPDGIADGYPRLIADDWDGLEGNLDASMTILSGKTYFFKGRHYWRFTNKKMDSGYPKLINLGFQGIPHAIDAAFMWSDKGKAYFFKGDQYWKYDSDIDPPVSQIYPRPISIWKGLPNNIDAAFQWENNRSYIFKEDKYYRLHEKNFEVESGDPPYPRSTSISWFNCNAISQGRPIRSIVNLSRN